MSVTNINNPEKFCSLLVKHYLSNGFGSLSKRDIEVLFLHCLCEDKQFSLPGDLHSACRKLKISESKMRGLMRDSQLKYLILTPEEAKSAFVKLVENAEFSRVGQKISFIVRDPLLRLYVEEWIAKANAFSDTSFNPNVVTMGREGLIKFITNMKPHSVSLDMIDKLPDEISSKISRKSWKDFIYNFADEFLKSAGKEAGALSVKGIASGLALLLGM